MSLKVKINGFFFCMILCFFKNYVEIEFKLKKGNYVGINYLFFEVKKLKSGWVVWCDC